jgi:hypothetical protein
MPTTPPTRRRWFRFSLRTLFVVVTAVAVWLAYYIHWMDERRDARAWIDAQYVGGSIGFYKEPRPGLPWMLRILGEKPEKLILMQHGPSTRDDKQAPPEYERLLQRVTSLFPEAQVINVSREYQKNAPDLPQVLQP